MILKRRKSASFLPDGEERERERSAYDVSRSWFTCTSSSQKKRNARPRLLLENAKYRRKKKHNPAFVLRSMRNFPLRPAVVSNCLINTIDASAYQSFRRAARKGARKGRRGFKDISTSRFQRFSRTVDQVQHTSVYKQGD